MLLNNQWITEEIRGNLKTYLETKDNENTTIQNLWDVAKAVLKREVYSNTILLQETRKIPNKQPNLTPKETEKEEQTNPKLVEGKKS